MTLSAIYELIQNTTSLNPDFDRSGLLDIQDWGRSRSIEMVMPAIIIGVSRISISCSLKLLYRDINLTLSAISERIQNKNGSYLL